MSIKVLLSLVLMALSINTTLFVLPRFGYIETATADRISQLLMAIGFLALLIGSLS
jgi:hypothetical protein